MTSYASPQSSFCLTSGRTDRSRIVAGEQERVVDFGMDSALFAGIRNVAVQLRTTNDLPSAR